jgi:AcrR family transcriptional regulator
MPRQSRRRHQQGEESRQRILDAAFEIASERGYDGTTLALVTQRAGLPASSVYWQFKNKDELLAEAIEYNYREWRASRTAWTELVEDEDLDVQVETALHHLATGLVTQPAFQRLGLMLALERRAVEASARARFRKVRNETITMMTGWWHRVLPSSAIATNPQAPHELAQMMIAVSDGLFIATQTDEGLDHARLVDLMTIGMQAMVHHFLDAAKAEGARTAP